MSANINSNKPIIGITMGDAAGIGPELCLQVLQSSEMLDCCRPVIFGNHSMLKRVGSECGIFCPGSAISADEWDGEVKDDFLILDCIGLDSAKICCGKIQAECGSAAYDYISRGISAALSGKISAIVTAPIHKEALQLAGVPFHGHTEMLASQTGTKDYCMMLTSKAISVCLVTTHLAINAVPQEINEERILKVIELAAEAMMHMNYSSRAFSSNSAPSLTVCSLNPHSGENGIFGNEENDLIVPAIKRARAAGYSVTGPLPPDTAFVKSQREKTDAYIVMYHDQGLIPFKMLAFDTGVNVTLGLPIIRTSVDHGTAFDIAWKGKASPTSMFEAIKTAVKLSCK